MSLFDSSVVAKDAADFIEKLADSQSKSIAQRLVRSAGDVFIQAAARGMSRDALRSALSERWGAERQKGGLDGAIYTATRYIFNGAKLARSKANGVEFMFYDIVDDEATTTFCRALYGTIVGIEDAASVMPPNHWRCRAFLRDMLADDARHELGNAPERALTSSKKSLLTRISNESANVQRFFGVAAKKQTFVPAAYGAGIRTVDEIPASRKKELATAYKDAVANMKPEYRVMLGPLIPLPLMLLYERRTDIKKMKSDILAELRASRASEGAKMALAPLFSSLIGGLDNWTTMASKFAGWGWDSEQQNEDEIWLVPDEQGDEQGDEEPFTFSAPGRIKTLVVRQPWANLIASGRKTIETRRWATSYRGPVLIASSKIPNIAPAGCAVALATLVDCRPMTSGDETLSLCPVESGAFSWIFRDIRRTNPIPIKGRLGLYDQDIPRGLI